MPFAKAILAISTFIPESSWYTILISQAFLPETANILQPDLNSATRTYFFCLGIKGCSHSLLKQYIDPSLPSHNFQAITYSLGVMRGNFFVIQPISVPLPVSTCICPCPTRVLSHVCRKS
nr:hypothetical protein Iba_scaffold17804CG0170 [Ipomoea batatas]